jgi:hypothetical protein
MRQAPQKSPYRPDEPPAFYRGTPTPKLLVPGSVLWRVHSRQRAPHEFRPPPSPGTVTGRFDSPSPDGYPWIYFGCREETALTERLLRDVPFSGRDHRILPFAHVEGQRLSAVRVSAELRLIALESTSDLAAVSADERIIHCRPRYYPITRRWALWLRTLDERVQGLIWTTRRDLPKPSLILFGDRISDGALEPHRLPYVDLDTPDGLDYVNTRLELYHASVEGSP